VTPGLATVERIRAARPDFQPRIGLILGSGMGGLTGLIEQPTVIGYGDLPGFPAPGVAGHAGRLILGRLGGVDVVALEGRVHAYEGDAAAPLATMVRSVRQLGADLLLLTNASGSLRAEVPAGSLVAISDHINFLGFNPLTGPNDERIGPRFPSMQDAYDPALRALLRQAAERLGVPLAEGVYLAYPGPNFETAAEIRAFRILGADLVGMSTVPEVLLARHCGLRVAALSIVTNLAQGMDAQEPSHADTLAVAARAAVDLGRLIRGFLEAIADGA